MISSNFDFLRSETLQMQQILKESPGSPCSTYGALTRPEILGKVWSKNGPKKICRRQPLKI